MADDILIFKQRRGPGRAGRWRRWLGRRVLIAAAVIAGGAAAHQLGAERGAGLADLWAALRGAAVEASAVDPAAPLRRMPICLGALRVNCVVDGDTAWIDGEKIRIGSIDAPESEGRCAHERELARRAKQRLSQLLSAEPFSVARSGKDRYGRTLATIRLRTGEEVGSVLVREGLARVWAGHRMPWC